MDRSRIHVLKNSDRSHSQPVLYWMSRDQRARDNWALIYAQEIAFKNNAPLAVAFCLQDNFLSAPPRHFDFMLRGLEEVERELLKKNIPFFLLKGAPQNVLPKFIDEHKIGTLITDFDPLKIKRSWKTALLKTISIPLIEVDAHNIVPCRVASDKQEFAARTIRPKIQKLLPEFLQDIPVLKKHPVDLAFKSEQTDWVLLKDSLKINKNIKPLDWIIPGENAAYEVLKTFLKEKLNRYDEERNDPAKDAQSNLSPYLHYGQISAQRVALDVERAEADFKNKEKFLEELIVRRELSDNFCFYNDNYDNFDGFPAWAQKTLNDHRRDKREIVYSLEELEAAQTHDEIWNAAHREMLLKGKMHGYMRMYWAKKILEWTETPEAAMEYAVYLNDKYSLDGRDPNGYTGCAWSIGGVHDRPWFARPVFGTVRYMNASGLKKKFDTEKYVLRFKK